MILGIIGSSSFLGSPLFSSFEKKSIQTAYGEVIVHVGKVNSMDVVYISRHECSPGEKYMIPNEVNYKALISAYKECNCDYVLGTYAFDMFGFLKLDDHDPLSNHTFPLVIPLDH